MKQTNIKYELISASGNPTALISGKYNTVTKQIINQEIFDSNKIVEQIGYIYKLNNVNYFEMMGNEFSGNGCRAAGFCFLNLQSGNVIFRSCGTKDKIKVSIDKNLNSSVTIPNGYQLINKKFFCLKMLNNYQIVIESDGSLEKAKEIISQLPTDTPGIGVMFINRKSDQTYNLNPYFYTRETKTLVNETACGSGSTAVAIYLSQIKKQGYKNLRIIQPSRMSININCDYKNQLTKNIIISGPTKSLGNYNVKIKL